MCLNIVWAGGLCLAIAWLIFVWIVGLSITSVFILGAATGLVFAPFFPLSFGFFNKRLNVVPMLIALLLCGSALGAITFQKIAGIKYIFLIFKIRKKESYLMNVFFFLGFILDKNPEHFPTLLIICILMSILFYIASNVVYFIHQKKNLLDARASLTRGAALTPEGFNEEQELSNQLRNQENK